MRPQEASSAGERATVHRVLQDGPWVMVHAAGTTPQRGNLFDVFRVTSGRVVEYRGYTEPAAPLNLSGHTQLDGPTQPRDLELTEQNKTLVRDYYETVHLRGHHETIPDWFTGDACIRHEPGVRDGVQAFGADVSALMRHRTIDELQLLIGAGDFVFLTAAGTRRGAPCVYVDLYRVEHSKIAEHWGFPQDLPRTNTA